MPLVAFGELGLSRYDGCHEAGAEPAIFHGLRRYELGFA
jgi:hypothetical protein